MSVILRPVTTTAGIAAAWNASKTGIKLEIASVTLGLAGYTPNESSKIKSPVVTYPVASGKKSGSQIHIDFVADDSQAFWVREVSFNLTDGTPFSIWSDPTTALLYKEAGDRLIIGLDFALKGLPADSITVVAGDPSLNLALAEELAALAAAQMAGMLRDYNQQDLLTEQAKTNLVEGQQIDNLMGRMKAAELRLDSDYDGLLSAVAANAAGLIGLQTILIKTTFGV